MQISSHAFYLVTSYYNAVWKFFDKQKVLDLFDDNVTYQHIDENNVVIQHLTTKKDYDEKLLTGLFDLIQKDTTQILNFQIKGLDNNRVQVDYIIMQEHTRGPVEISCTDTFAVKDGLITEFTYKRNSKVHMDF